MAITGIIRPPPEIRAVADRTASYVAKNGRAFESRILKSEKGKTPKFAFLQPTSPFHAYYEDRIQFYENGGADDDDDGAAAAAADGAAKKQESQKKVAATRTKKGAPSDPASTPKSDAPEVRKKDKRQKASAMDPIAKAILDQRAKLAEARARQQKEIEERAKVVPPGHDAVASATQSVHPPSRNVPFPLPPPPSLELVSVVAPSNLSPTEIETIQLVAQFAAMDGKGGDFLRQLTIREWSNPEFRFCQPRHAHFAYFSALVDAYRKVLHEWTEAATTAVAASAAAETSMGRLPVSDVKAILTEAAFRAEYEREMEEHKSQQEEGEVITIDWHDFVVVETIEFPPDEVVELAMLPPPPPTSMSTVVSGIAGTAASLSADGRTYASKENDEMVESDDDEEEEEEEAIRVVPTYTPKVVGTSSLLEARAIDPITGKSIPVADMPEHMRIQLLDPKWAEERKKFQEKQKDSNLVGGDAIVSNISRFAQGRGDDDSKMGMSSISDNPKRRLEEANRIIRDQAAVYPVPPVAAKASVQAVPPPVSEPPAKRQRMAMNLPPPGPPRPPLPPALVANRNVAPGPPEIPPAAASIAVDGLGATQPFQPSSAMDQSGNDVMTDFMGFPSGEADGTSSTTPKTDFLSEDDFVKTLAKPEVTLLIRMPNDPTQMAWNFYGQTLSMTVHAMTQVKDVAAELSKQHLNGMPANKIQLKDPKGGFLNNNKTLAALNIGPIVTLDMKAKQRGGRK